jgi:DNA repair exonuclease SbcCD ATPase subunit
MSDTTSPHGFDIVRRGYERTQVDDRITKLVADRDSSLQRIAALENRIEELHLESQNAHEQLAEAEPSYAGLGARVEKILRLAEEEAKDLREEARRAADQHRDLSEQAAAQVRADAEQYGKERKAKADEEAARIAEKAKDHATQVRAEAARDAAAKREEAEALFEETRAKAGQAAADFETNLAKRREQAERDLAARQAKAEKRLAEIENRAEQLRLEAEKLRTDAERRSRQTIETAQRQADDIVADARSKADRIRSESERELAALTHRRDSINAQLTNVREMLATLTGAAVAAGGGPGADDDKLSVPAQPAH